MKTLMTALGAPSIFDQELANLSGISAVDHMSVTDAKHKATITVDEDGSEAAASTGVVAGDDSAPVPVEATHPFVFMIHDAVTDSILFMGRVVDPTQPAAP